MFPGIQTLESLLIMIQIRCCDDYRIDIGFQEFIQGAAELRFQFMFFG